MNNFMQIGIWAIFFIAVGIFIIYNMQYPMDGFVGGISLFAGLGISIVYIIEEKERKNKK